MNVENKVFPHEKLVAISGTLQGHIFENERTGLKQSFFINLRIDFSPLDYSDETWECSFGLEWMLFPGGSWKNISHISMENPLLLQRAEASFYMASHDDCSLKKVNISYKELNLFHIEIEAEVDFQGYDEDDRNPHMPLKIDVTAPFQGFSVDRNLFFPKPNTTADAEALATKFVDLESFHPPLEKKGTFKFFPKY
ncbi:MAG: hypothetical protein ACK5YY_06785 [Alphaproteobacteria bacterium]|jgi:hypothetical protein